jgi:signal peptidase I
MKKNNYIIMINIEDILKNLKPKDKQKTNLIGLDFFMICQDHFITSSNISDVKYLQKYFDWLLGYENQHHYNFVPVIETCKQVKIIDIDKIIIKNSYDIKTSNNKENNYQSKTWYLKNDLFKKLGLKEDCLSDIINNNILSAKLEINFQKPKKMKDDIYSNILGNYIKTFNDDDDITLRLKNGKTIKGGNILKQKSVSLIEDNKLIGNAINEFKAFMKEL